MSYNELIWTLRKSEVSKLSILAEEEFIPGHINYSILDISLDYLFNIQMIKPWNYSIEKSKLIPFSRVIHKGILLNDLRPLILNAWNPCDENHLPENKSNILISTSYDKNTLELYNSDKWHLGKFHKPLLFEPYVKGKFLPELTKYKYQSIYDKSIYSSKIKMDSIPFYKCLKWINLTTILNMTEYKHGCSKNETTILNLE